MEHVTLGRSDLRVSKVCLGTMTFGEQQVDEATSHSILSRALERGLNFIDTAEMYPVPPSERLYAATERIIGRWFDKHPAARARVVLATKVAGPVRGYSWLRNGSADLTADHIVAACDASLQRLRTDVIDLYQIHWPVRHVPMFGGLYFEPARDKKPHTPIEGQLRGLQRLVQAGKVRHVGLSNETPWGVCEFVRLADASGLPRVVSVQNPYCLVNRAVDNGLDEALYRSGVSLLAYSPLAFGLLSGKYDDKGFDGPDKPGRLSIFESMKQQRWGRPETLAAARRYNALAREHGLTPTQMALGFCAGNWRVASTIIGVTSVAQLDQNLDACATRLSDDLQTAIDLIRWTHRDPAQ